MTTIILVIHVILAIAMVITVLLQRSDGGALGSLGGGGGLGGVMSGRQSANLLTRATGILAAAFMGTSLILAIIASRQSQPTSILDQSIESELPPLSTGAEDAPSGDLPDGSTDPVSDGPRVPVSE